jgi:hypothetical protein
MLAFGLAPLRAGLTTRWPWCGPRCSPRSGPRRSGDTPSGPRARGLVDEQPPHLFRLAVLVGWRGASRSGCRWRRRCSCRIIRDAGDTPIQLTPKRSLTRLWASRSKGGSEGHPLSWTHALGAQGVHPDLPMPMRQRSAGTIPGPRRFFESTGDIDFPGRKSPPMAVCVPRPRKTHARRLQLDPYGLPPLRTCHGLPWTLEPRMSPVSPLGRPANNHHELSS